MYIGLSILDMNKMVKFGCWHDYIKPKYGKKTKLCYMDIDSFIVHVKLEGIYADLAEDVKKKFDARGIKLGSQKNTTNAKNQKEDQLDER